MDRTSDCDEQDSRALPRVPIGVGTHQHISLPSPPDLLKAKIQMAVNRLMATYLGNLEELADEHDEAMGKLMDALPIELRVNVHLADVYGEARFDAIRRHVLKTGNEQKRELFELVDYLRLGGAGAEGGNL